MHPTVSQPSNLRRLLLLAASLGVGAVGWFLLGEPPHLKAEEAASVAKSRVLARIDGVAITEAEIHDKIAGELLELDRQRHQLIERAVRNEARERLLVLEAAKRGVDTRLLLASEVEAKLAQVPQEKVDASYESRKLRRPKEAVEPQIRRLLAFETFEESLRKSYPVEILLEPFQVELDARGPAKGPADGPVSPVELSDFECPSCNRAHPAIDGRPLSGVAAFEALAAVIDEEPARTEDR